VPEVKMFGLYHPSWVYLQSCPKYATITTANVAAQKNLDGKKNVSPTDDATAERPVGKKKAKHLAEEKKIFNIIVVKLKGSVNNCSAGQVWQLLFLRLQTL
jgi:hypothetical protein